MAIQLPRVIDNFDGQIAQLDQAIREAAEGWKFRYDLDAPKFNDIQTIPEIVYALIRHYTLRGFICEYDGNEGKLQIRWNYPNMSYLDQKQVTRATPEMIPKLGLSFKASLIYLCMTNGVDLRDQSDITLQRQLEKSVKEAANLGNTELCFGFPEVPSPAVLELFKPTFDMLLAQGFQVSYNVNSSVFILKWGNTFDLGMHDGETASSELDQ